EHLSGAYPTHFQTVPVDSSPARLLSLSQLQHSSAKTDKRRGDMMLTRKQRWRRIQHQRSFVEPSAPAPATRLNIDGCMGATSPRPPCRPHPIDALSVGDSLRQLVRSSTPSSSSSCTPPPPPAPPVEDTPATKSVCFHHQVRVILVPCRRELRALQLQLWWGADDYQHFRREYVMLLRMAAQKHHDDN
ncbi:unnamed protein product, partial [Scytosiphon promiscuus]